MEETYFRCFFLFNSYVVLNYQIRLIPRSTVASTYIPQKDKKKNWNRCIDGRYYMDIYHAHKYTYSAHRHE